MPYDELFGLDIDLPFLLSEAFLGYKYRKSRHQLYKSDSLIPTKLISAYYSIKINDDEFDKMKKAFITHYVNNESKVEGLDPKDSHSKEEIEGIKKMYDYIHSDEIDYMFNIYTLKELHEKLYSCTDHPEFGGEFRRVPVYLPGSGCDLCEWEKIRPSLNELDEEVINLHKLGPVIKNTGNTDALFNYLDACVVLKCKLIKIHPFFDGNGRSVRGFINKLLEDAGLPPIYIKANEKLEYENAMNKAINEGDYTDIKGFYRYKICDSIIELDINEKVRTTKEISRK